MTRQDFRTIAATLHEPSAVTTRDGRFVAMNDAMRALLRTYECADAERLHDLVVDDEHEVEAFLQTASRTRPAVQGRLTLAGDNRDDRMTCYGGLLHRSSGDTYLLLRLYRSHEAVTRFQLLGRKVDELNAEIRRRKHVEAELWEIGRTLEKRVEDRTADLERTNTELIRSNQALEEFASVASHDLREPLRKITVFSEMLQEEAASNLSGEQRSILSRIFAAAGRMELLIESLLSYARVSTSRSEFARVDLTDVVASVIDDLEVVFAQSKAEIDVDPLPVLDADETQMRQLFQNLISNSLKFHRSGVPPRIRITASRLTTSEDRSVHAIELADNGIGIGDEFVERIFDPYRRLHSQTDFEGTGIGLAVCRRIVERHGGSITAEGRPTEGAIFRITLPEQSSHRSDD